MASAYNTKVREELAKEFEVNESECDKYNEFYEGQVLPRINRKFLAHMVAVVEEIINAKIQERAENTPKQETEAPPALGRYNIIVSDKVRPVNNKAVTRCFKKGAIIMHIRNEDKNDIENEKMLRIYVAHELGHLLLKYGVIENSEQNESHANLLAYFAISGKNDFYVNKAPNFIYKNGESEIINKIKTSCGG